jgi:hypothetical protein
LKATNTEIAQLLGYYYDGKVPANLLRIGAKISPSTMYSQLDGIYRAKKTMKEIRNKLKEISIAFEEVEPIIPKVEMEKGE